MSGNLKVALLGGGGVRTPLLMHGLAHSHSLMGLREVVLYDVDRRRAELMAVLGREIARDRGIAIRTAETPEDALEGASFVISSVRAGGAAARARDERTTIECGLAGQETTGPAGLAMALRTVPEALRYAHLMERYAPGAWLVNFTNPAGLITQALMQHSGVRVVGICDTPEELFHRIAWSLGEPYEEMEFHYAGLNHLGWVRRVELRGQDITGRLLGGDPALSRLYPGDLFDPELIRTLRLIPTEYLFFYYSQRKAWRNQTHSGASRGEELVKLNAALWDQLESAMAQGEAGRALGVYKNYLNRRNGSYMRLEGSAQSAFAEPEHDWNPFEGVTGYHRIAVETIAALIGHQPSRIVLNVRNGGAIADLDENDVVEVPCMVDQLGPRPLATGALPAEVRGLTIAVKTYERLTIRAAVEKSLDLARLALLTLPIVGQWELASEVLSQLVKNDPAGLGYLR